jgi:hypothetical protein
MVDTLGALSIWLGFLLVLLGAVFFVIAAFRESILWGLGVLFVPFVPLVFLILEWPSAKRPFFWQLWGLALIFLGAFVLAAPLPFIHGHH